MTHGTRPRSSKRDLRTGRLHWAAWSLGGGLAPGPGGTAPQRGGATDERAAVPVARGVAVEAVHGPQEVERRGHADVVEQDAPGCAPVSNPATRCETAQVKKTPLIAVPESDQPSSSGRRAICVRAVKSRPGVVGEQDQVRRQRAQVDVHRGGVAQGLPQGGARDAAISPAGPGAAACATRRSPRPPNAASRRSAMKTTAGASRAPAPPASGRGPSPARWRGVDEVCGPQVNAITAKARPKCEKPRSRRCGSARRP